jgi:hypothetical protein
VRRIGEQNCNSPLLPANPPFRLYQSRPIGHFIVFDQSRPIGHFFLFPTNSRQNKKSVDLIISGRSATRQARPHGIFHESHVVLWVLLFIEKCQCFRVKTVALGTTTPRGAPPRGWGLRHLADPSGRSTVALVKEIGATTISRMPAAYPWEYVVGGLPVSDKSISQSDILNDWGRDGWELVSVVFSPEQGGAYLYYFTRQIPAS